MDNYVVFLIIIAVMTIPFLADMYLHWRSKEIFKEAIEEMLRKRR